MLKEVCQFFLWERQFDDRSTSVSSLSLLLLLLLLLVKPDIQIIRHVLQHIPYRPYHK